MCYKITYPFPNFSGAAVEVSESISNFMPHFTGHVITLPMLGLKLIHASKRGPCCHIFHHDMRYSMYRYSTEALKGHRVVWKIEIYYLIRMTYEWKSMSSGWHNNIVVTHPDEIPISAKSSGWHMVVWYVIRMTYCSVQKSSGWDTARS